LVKYHEKMHEQTALTIPKERIQVKINIERVRNPKVKKKDKNNEFYVILLHIEVRMIMPSVSLYYFNW